MSEKKQDNAALLMETNNYAFYPQLDSQGKETGLTLFVNVEATEKGYFLNRELVSDQESRGLQERFRREGGESVNASLNDVMEVAEAHGLRFSAKSLNAKGDIESHERPFDEDYVERSADEMVFETDPIRQISKSPDGLPVISAVSYEIDGGHLRVKDKIDASVVYNKDARTFDVSVGGEAVAKKKIDIDSLTLENRFDEADRIDMQQTEAAQKKEDMLALNNDQEAKQILGAEMQQKLKAELDELLMTRVYDPEFVDQVTFAQMEQERGIEQSRNNEEKEPEIVTQILDQSPGR